MSRQSWLIAGALTAAILVAALGWSFFAKQRELEQVRTALAQSQGEAGELSQKLTNSQARIRELQQEREAVVQTHKSLEEEMRAALESKDVTISQLQGKLTVSILDRILFDSGEAELKPDGADLLRKIAIILTQHPTLKLHVVGHTDDVPIKPAARKRFASNWELSTARATAAVRFLTEQAGVDPRRLGATGYGEFRPVADNTTPAGRAQNRRIAIVILSDETAGADTASAVTADAPVAPAAPAAITNAPPAQPATAPPAETNNSGTSQPPKATPSP